MSTFTIDSANNITAFASQQDATAAKIHNAEYFTSARELNKLASSWPGSRLCEVWNSFAGIPSFEDLKPVKKFRDRKMATARIWAAIQRLVPELPPDGTSVQGSRDKDPRQGNGRDTARQNAKETANIAREDSKKAEVLALMRRSKGATLAEIMEKTAWQAHTVRGFVSGTLIKKLGLAVESFRTDQKERCYRITN